MVHDISNFPELTSELIIEYAERKIGQKLFWKYMPIIKQVEKIPKQYIVNVK